MNTPKHNASGTTSACRPNETDDLVSEARYRAFMEEVADGFYETDLKGNFTFFNNAFCRIFGYELSEMMGRNFREFMDEKTAELAFQSFNRIYRTGRDLVDIIWWITRKDGSRRILETSARLIIDAHGSKMGFRGISRDVTENHRARQSAIEAKKLAECQYEASRQAELRYRAFLEFLPDPVFVFNLDNTVSYLNPAFERVFGWTLAELEGEIIPFVPPERREETRQGFEKLLREKVIHGFETQRMTKEGRLLDIVLDAAVFYDEHQQPAGQVVILRDVTHEKRIARVNQALFRIAEALYRFRRLDERLEFIARQVQDLLEVEGASVILLDESRREFYFRVAAFEDSETGDKMKEVRFPADKGVAGEVYRTGRPLIVPDTSKSPHYFGAVDQKAGYSTRMMLDVPIHIQDRMIGVLCAVNKKAGVFDDVDAELLAAVASIIALPVENARINEELKRSYEEVKSLNRAKDRVIHHLSHELKTPVSVLSASLGLLHRQEGAGDPVIGRILQRADRNLERILDMQYAIEDILREKDYTSHQMLSLLLDASIDVIESFAAEETGSEKAAENIRRRIDDLFGPREAVSKIVSLGQFVAEKIEALRPRFAHRTCRVDVRIETTEPVEIPPEVLEKIIEGLVRNAVENTPDEGLIEVTVRSGARGPELEVKDYGVGITEENQRLIFENYFTSYEPMQYSSRRPYDFNAGGKGFDLLRMKIFSERYGFKLEMVSERCAHLPDEEETGPGSVDLCASCNSIADCMESGGTTMTVIFSGAEAEPAKIEKNG
jgi:PAS domain S-box-containing protein